MRPAVGFHWHTILPLEYIVYSGTLRVFGAYMSHMVRDTSQLLKRVRRIRGQIEAVERTLEQEIGCEDIMQLIAATRGAINAEVMEDHIRVYATDPERDPNSERAQATKALIDVVRSYLK